jgi:hypothetical protein
MIVVNWLVAEAVARATVMDSKASSAFANPAAWVDAKTILKETMAESEEDCNLLEVGLVVGLEAMQSWVLPMGMLEAVSTVLQKTNPLLGSALNTAAVVPCATIAPRITAL